MATIRTNHLAIPEPVVIDLHSFTGEVVDLKNNSETKIWSTTPGLYDASLQASTNYVFTPQTKSATTHKETLFVRDESGAETVAEITNPSIPVRVGNKVTLAYAKGRNDSSGKQVLFGLVNCDTGQGGKLAGASGLATAFDGRKNMRLFWILMAIFVLGSMLFGGHWAWGIAGIVLAYAAYVAAIIPSFLIARKKFNEDIERQLDSLTRTGNWT